MKVSHEKLFADDPWLPPKELRLLCAKKPINKIKIAMDMCNL